MEAVQPPPVRWPTVILVSLVLAIAAAVFIRLGLPAHQGPLYLVVLLVAGVAGYVVLLVPPSYSLSVALFLGLFGSNWDVLGLKGSIAPDRFLLAATVVAVLIRAPCTWGRPTLQLRSLHGLMAVVIAIGFASATAAGTLTKVEGITSLFDRLGILGFGVFLVAPVVFATPRDRDVLLTTLVLMGGYLGLTALFETIGARALVFPGYITDPNVGIHFGRARGPFAQAALNGLAIYACLVACLIALRQWTVRWHRVGAMAIAALLLPSLLFTLQRSIWLGATVATVVTMLVVRDLRRYVVPALVLGVVSVSIALVAIPGFAGRVQDRRSQSETVAGRKALDDNALAMISERPLLGFGWGVFVDRKSDYYQASEEYSLKVNKNLILHNVYLANAVELGLIGAALWLAAMLLGIGGAVLQRGPPELDPWRIGLGAIFFVWLIVGLAAPLRGSFQSVLLWTWAAVIVGAASPARASGTTARRG